MSHKLIVRKARRDDLGQIVNLWIEQGKFHAHLDPLHARNPRSRPSIVKYVRSSLYSSRALLLVAEDKGRVVGFACAHLCMRPPVFKVRPFGYIDDAYLIPAYRHKGIVKLFLLEYNRWFKKKKITFVELSVLMKNQIGRNAWKKHGFKDSIMRMRKKL